MTTIAIVVLLILAGMVMIFFEFLTPTFGPLAVMGLACLGGAAWQCFTISTFAGVISIAAMLVGLPVYILAMVRIMPRLPLTRSLFLHKFPVSTATAVRSGRHMVTSLTQLAFSDFGHTTSAG